MIEVWESRELWQRYSDEFVEPLMAELSRGEPPPGAPAPQEFEVRGLVIPRGGITL